MGFVEKGDVISAKKFNESTFGIGDIKQSLLTQAQFQSQFGDCWVSMEGQNISGSDFSALTSIVTLPDARGRFLRTLGGDAAPLAQTQEDMFKAHFHYQGSGHGAEPFGATNLPGYGTDFLGHGDGYSAVSAHTSTQGGSETRPKNVTVNVFIKINHQCN